MKINYKNTALGFLDGSVPLDFHVPDNSGKQMTLFEVMDFKESVKESLKNNGTLFLDDVRYVSDSFFQAYSKGKSKLKSVIFEQEINESGTLIYNHNGNTTTIFYALSTGNTKAENWDLRVVIILFSKNSHMEKHHLDACIVNTPEKCKSFLWKGYQEKGIDQIFWMSWLITFLTFVKYCETETKIILAGRKDHHAGVKYLNETKQKIQILDSSWFTTIIHSEGFTVGADTGGFFRLQPYGPGNTKKKLIWVLPFEKKGYTRIAKVENLRNVNND